MSAIDIDPQFEDVDFPSDPEYTFGDCGVDVYQEEEFGTYEDVIQTYTETELRTIEEQQRADGGGEEFVTRIFDQGREGACVFNACSQAAESTQAKTFGKDKVVHLSAMSGYKQIGRSASSGATVSSGMRCLRDIGALPLDSPENREVYGDQVMPNTGFKNKYPDGWKKTAAHFQALEIQVIRSVEGILTALARQEFVVVGREGHSICYVTLIWDNGWKVAYPNSWSLRWGQPLGDHKGGFGIDTLRQIKKSAGWAFAVRTVRGRIV